MYGIHLPYNYNSWILRLLIHKYLNDQCILFMSTNQNIQQVNRPVYNNTHPLVQIIHQIICIMSNPGFSHAL